MKIINQISSSIANKIPKKTKYNFFDDDVLLVSYPKSGNTWVRFLFANLLKESSSEIINFHNVHRYCPELDIQNKEISKLHRPRVIKSHQLYNASFPRVIYIVRDCRDVYVSYYHYVKNNIPADWSFKDFIELHNFPYGYWSHHVNSWINSKSEDLGNFKIVLYEDLLENTFASFSEMVNFSGLASTPNQIEQAIENSTFLAMKTVEKKYGRKFSVQDNAESFVREGKAKQWVNYFGIEELKVLANRGELKTLQHLGYSI